MKKKIFTFFLALVAGTGTMFAEKVKIGDLYYDLFVYNQTARVARNSVGGDIVIPASVTYNSETYSVTSIGDSAFYNCSRLTSIEIPNSVTYIGYNAFDYCSGLTSVHISDIAAWCAIICSSHNPMYYAHNLYLNGELVTDLVIPNSVTSIGEEAFYGCSSLTSVTIPNSVTSIEKEAFYGCSSLTSVHISDIAAWCAIFFSDNPLKYAHNLYLNGELVTDLVIPNSVTSIAYQAFYGCSSLTSVTIPNSVTSIRDHAFRNCTSLTSVTIPNSVTSIGNRAFFDCTGLTSVTIGNSVTSIGDWAFYNCSGLSSVIWNAKECSDFTDQSPFIRRITSFIFGDEVEYIPANLCSGFSNLTSIIIPNSVDSIGGSAFLGCTGLTSVTIPNSVTSIGEKAFLGCSGLTSVTIPNSVIGEYAFLGCRGLTSVTIPNSVDSIGNYAFYSCDSLTSVTINSNKVLSRNYNNGDNLITRFGSQVSEYVIGDSVTRIGNYAFCDQYGTTSYSNHLKSITIGNSVTSIGGGAFKGCSSLTSVIIPNSVTSIGGGAFYSCRSLTSVTIGNNVTSIAYQAFYGCHSLTSVTIGNSVTSIGNEAFLYCRSLPSVTIPNSVTSIGEKAFSYCSELRYIYMIAQTPPSIGSYALPLNSSPNNFKTIYVPCNSADDYKVAWSGYADYIYARCSSTINFVNWDGSNLQASQVTYGDMPQYTGIQPTKPSDSQYTYTFAGWTPNIGPAVRSTTYKATFTAEPKSGLSYTINFVNWDGSNLQTLDITEGDMPQYTGATPTRPDDSQYTYTFSGWTPQIVAATEDATYTATFTAELISSSDCTDVNDTWLQTGGSGLGEITTDNSGVWKYEYQYGACAKANSGETGWLLTPAKDLRGMKSVNLSFLHVHKNAGTFTDDMTLWVCANYKGSVSASQWQQLTITPYSTNNNWVFVNVSIDVPLNMVGANTVFGFKYISSNGSAKWEIKELNLNAECAKADETTTTDVTATPNEDNSVTLTWPAVNGADTYTIEIKKNGVSVCTLVFNAHGQLISINFAAPARDGKGRNVPLAEQSANGWTYVVTGLEGNTSYTYSVTAKDVNGNVLLKQSVDFSTGVAQGIEDVLSDQVQCTKVMRNGQVFILRGDKTYTFTGQETIMP